MKSEQASELTREGVENALLLCRKAVGSMQAHSDFMAALCEHYLSTPAAVPCLVCGGYKTACKEAVQNICLCPTVAPKESGAVAWRDQPGDVFKSFKAICKLPDGDARKEAFLWFSHGYACMNPPAPWREAVKQLVADMRARNCGAAPGDIQRWAERIESLPAQQGDGNA